MRVPQRPHQPRLHTVLSLHQITVDGQLVANELAPPEKPSVGMTVLQTRRSRMNQRWRSRTLRADFDDEAIHFYSYNHVELLLFSFLLLKWQKAPGGWRSSTRWGRCVVAESDSHPGVAAEEEETEEAAHAGASSVLAASKVKIQRKCNFL